ncbi:hypothetical protein VT84_23235 [Gemmata sp. SH-PL17]|uniref:hypothetical protein n=1 Tax=Gemmata sp. SH-PL17 TaxID=1630693 RepID=UPI0004B6C391|nr:hypothetical protein [Gemmata sp. SH-PL17]AMV27333.1 hypothetical protein VT84_23235 [Gemmata sp. SH-PL17]
MGKKSKKEAPKPEEPKKEAPKPEAVKKEAPKSEPPKKELSKAEVLKNAMAKAKGKGITPLNKPAEVVPPPAVKELPAPPKPVVPEVKKKRKRFVREKQEKRVEPTGPALPPRSSKVNAKLMTKGLALPPQDDATGPKPR